MFDVYGEIRDAKKIARSVYLVNLPAEHSQRVANGYKSINTQIMITLLSFKLVYIEIKSAD